MAEACAHHYPYALLPSRRAAGVSRSAAVIAATIMRAKRLDADAAMQALRVRAPGAMPNAGFLAQLQLWGDMGWDLDTAHPGYKQHQLDMVRLI